MKYKNIRKNTDLKVFEMMLGWCKLHFHHHDHLDYTHKVESM